MTIEKLERDAESELARIISGSDAPATAHLLKRPGFKLRVQVSILSQSNGTKIRKKRGTANGESYDPRTDCILVTFEPDQEEQPETSKTLEPVGSSADGPASGSVTANSAEPDLPSNQIRTVVAALDRAEAAQHQFVGLKFFRDKVLLQTGESWTSDDSLRRRALKQLIDSGLIETGKVPNPQNAEFPVTTVRLNREHSLVKELSSRTPPHSLAEFRPIRQTGEFASRIILKDRR